MGSTSFEKVTGDDCAVATAAIANTARTTDVITLPPSSQHTGTASGLKFEADYIAFVPRAHFIPTIKKFRENGRKQRPGRKDRSRAGSCGFGQKLRAVFVAQIAFP